MAQAIIHLDTSFLIRALNANSSEDKQLRGWMADGVRLGMSAIGWTEFLCGPLDHRQLALAAAIDSSKTAELFNRSGRRRGSLIDWMIVAIAIRVGASLATANHSDFGRFSALHLE